MTAPRLWLGSALLSLVAGSSAPAQRITLTARVIDANQNPVPRANVVVARQGRYVADDSGHLSLQVQPGSVSLEIRRLGYQPSSSQLILDRDTTIDLMLLPIAQRLPGQKVVATAIDGLVHRGFYDRMRDADRGLIFGFFITPEDIEARRPFRSSQLLERVPGITLAGTGGNNVIPVGQNGCPLTVYLDGARLKLDDDTRRGRVSPGDSFDGVIGVTAIAGVEIYPRGTRAPARYQLLNGTCGIIAVWTK